MEEQELRQILAARERFAPDEDAVRAVVLARRGDDIQRRDPASNRRKALTAVLSIAAAVVLITTSVLIIGSVGSAPTATEISRIEQEVVDVPWILTSVSEGDVTVTPPDGTRFSLELRSNGSAVVGESCNPLTGTWSATSDGFELVQLVDGLLGCGSASPGRVPPDPVILAAVSQLETSSVHARREGDVLVLSSGAFVLKYRNSAPAVPPDSPSGRSAASSTSLVTFTSRVGSASSAPQAGSAGTQQTQIQSLPVVDTASSRPIASSESLKPTSVIACGKPLPETTPGLTLQLAFRSGKWEASVTNRSGLPIVLYDSDVTATVVDTSNRVAAISDSNPGLVLARHDLPNGQRVETPVNIFLSVCTGPTSFTSAPPGTYMVVPVGRVILNGKTVTVKGSPVRVQVSATDNAIPAI